MGPKMMNCCKREQVGTKENGKMLKLIQFLNTAGSMPKKRRVGRSKDEKRTISRLEYRRLWNDFETGGFKAQKGLRNVAREKEDVAGQRCIASKEEGDVVREYKAMHEENFPSNWVREDLEGTEERRTESKKDREEEKVVKERWREREKRRKRLWLKESVSTLFPVMFLRNLVPWMIWVVLGVLWKTFFVTLAVLRSVCLAVRRVCLL